MRTIRTTIDDDTYGALQRLAAARDLTVDALVGELLTSGLRESQERQLRDGIQSFKASDRLSRDDLYVRSKS